MIAGRVLAPEIDGYNDIEDIVGRPGPVRKKPKALRAIFVLQDCADAHNRLRSQGCRPDPWGLLRQEFSYRNMPFKAREKSLGPPEPLDPMALFHAQFRNPSGKLPGGPWTMTIGSWKANVRQLRNMSGPARAGALGFLRALGRHAA